PPPPCWLLSAPRSCPIVPALRPAPPWFRGAVSARRGDLPMRSACAKILLREASLPGGRQLALSSRKTTILFIRRRRKPGYRPNQDSQNCGTVRGTHPKGRIANLGLFCQAKRL